MERKILLAELKILNYYSHHSFETNNNHIKTEVKYTWFWFMCSEFHDDRPTKFGVTALYALNDERASQRLVSCVTNYRLGVYKPSHYTLYYEYLEETVIQEITVVILH